jgi:hypothetical protein
VLIADDFVFLHIPKTGGTFVQAVITAHMPRVDVGTYTHTTYDEFPVESRRLPGFYIVRNPWDWYVSWFHYSQQWGATRKAGHEPKKARKAIIWNDLLRRGEASFAEAVGRAVEGDFDHAAMFPALDEPFDLYTSYVRDIAGPVLDRPDFTAMRFENMRRQLRGYLAGRSGVSKDLLRAIRQSPPSRVSSHQPYADYYDDELRRLVATKTEWLCDRFGYRFGAAKTPSRA